MKLGVLGNMKSVRLSCGGVKILHNEQPLLFVIKKVVVPPTRMHGEGFDENSFVNIRPVRSWFFLFLVACRSHGEG